MSKTDPVFDIYELLFYLHNLSGYNTIEFREKWQKLAYAIPHLIVTSVLMINNVLCFYLSYRALDDPGELMYLLTMTITTSAYSVDILIMDVYMKEVEKLHRDLTRNLRKMEKFKKSRDVNWKLKQKFTIICKAFYSLAAVSLILFVALPVLFPGERSVPYVSPVKNLPSPYYEGLYVFQMLILFLFVLNAVSFDMICCGFILRVCTCLEIIASRLEEYGEFYPSVDYSEYMHTSYETVIVELHYNRNSDNVFSSEKSLLDCKKGQHFKRLMKETTEMLKSNIKLHQEIMGQLEIIDRIYNLSVVVRLIFGTVVFAIAASVMFSDNFNPLVDIRLEGFAMSGFIDLFIYCYFGSHIIESEEKVTLALYSLPWCEMDIKTRRIILFALMRSSKSKGITAGKIFKLDLQLFLQILKFAHSFIALLKKF